MKKSDTYGSVLAEIERLKQRAEELRQVELPGVIQRIREAIEAYGLTAADLGFGGGRLAATAGPRRRAAGARSGKLQTGVPKYRDPKSGKTWTGRGKPPLWIVGVKDRTPFLIDPAEATAAAPAAKPGRRVAGTGRKRGRRAVAAEVAGVNPSGSTD